MTENPSRPAASPTANAGAGANRFGLTARPTILGTGGMISTGHYLASSAALSVLQKGGNATDAGVAAGLCLNVVHNDMNTLSGVAPIIIHEAESGVTTSIAGIGTWPGAVSREEMERTHRGIPESLARCVVPAAAASWLKALRHFGSLSFEEVSEPARRYASEGFPVHTFMHHAISKYLHNYRRFEENRRLYLVDDEPPPVGTIIRQPELARTLERLVEVEDNTSIARRDKGLDAVTDEFYKGEIARGIADFSRRNGGLIQYDDLSSFEVEEEPVVRMDYGDWAAVACGPWSQGPAIAFALNILRNFDLAPLRHNSADYINIVASALDLSFADRNSHCGDPAFADVPMTELLSPRYGELRAGLIDPGTGFAVPQPPGDPRRMRPVASDLILEREQFGATPPVPPADTSCVTVVDGRGNFFAATPSDGYCNGPVIPGLGLHISERGSQSFLDPRDPNVVAPGKRPRLTPNPVLLLHRGTPRFAMATPGNDRQVQAMLQVLLNMAVFEMSPQEAVEAPRFASYNFRASTWPGNIEPGRLCLEEDIDDRVAGELAGRGRDIMRWPRWCWSAGGVVLSGRTGAGLYEGAADPRRESYAISI